MAWDTLLEYSTVQYQYSENLFPVQYLSKKLRKPEKLSKLSQKLVVLAYGAPAQDTCFFTSAVSKRPN